MKPSNFDKTQCTSLKHHLTVAADIYDSNILLLKQTPEVPGTEVMVDQFVKQAKDARDLIALLDDVSHGT